MVNPIPGVNPGSALKSFLAWGTTFDAGDSTGSAMSKAKSPYLLYQHFGPSYPFYIQRAGIGYEMSFDFCLFCIVLGPYSVIQALLLTQYSGFTPGHTWETILDAGY